MWRRIGALSVDDEAKLKKYETLRKYFSSSCFIGLRFILSERGLSFTEVHRYHCQRVNECALTRNISDLLQIIYGVGGLELRDLSYDVTIWCQMSTKVQGRFPIDRFHKEPQTHVEELHPCPIYIYFSFPIDFESLASFLLEHAIFLLLAVKIIRAVDHQQKTELEEQTFG